MMPNSAWVYFIDDVFIGVFGSRKDAMVWAFKTNQIVDDDWEWKGHLEIADFICYKDDTAYRITEYCLSAVADE